jgi:hypothetical protein
MLADFFDRISPFHQNNQHRAKNGDAALGHCKQSR